MDQEIEEGIERYISHIRKMSLLTDLQIRMIVAHTHDQDPDMVGVTGVNIENYISKIRELSSYDEHQLRSILRDAASKDANLRDVLIDASQKKLLKEMKDMAKDIRSDPSKLARRVA